LIAAGLLTDAVVDRPVIVAVLGGGHAGRAKRHEGE
jgi:hypothetical protein